MDLIELSDIVSAFQDQCAQGIWAHDNIVNKQMGDGLMAIFNSRGELTKVPAPQVNC